MSSNEISVAELGRIVTGRTPPTSDAENFGGDFLFVTPSDLDWKTYYCRSTERTVSSAVHESFGGTFVPEGAVLVTCIGNTIGKCAIAPVTCLTNQQINSVIPRERRYSSFIYYLMLNNVGQIRQVGIGGGAATPIVNKSTFSRLRFRVPDKSTWEEIGRILCAYDDLIENNRRRIALLEQSARLLYREWFVHLRFPGHEHVKVLDGVPEGWAINSIAEMFDTTSGGTPSRSVPEYFVGDINWVKTQELDELFIFDTEEHISEAALKNSAAKLFPEGTLLVSIYGGTNIGRTGLLAKAAASNQACVALMPKRHPDDVLFAQKWLQENRGHMVGLGQGAAQTNISQQTLRSQKMLVPTVELLDEFVGAIKPMYQQIANICKQNAKLRDARDLLLPRLMSGDLVV